MFRRIAFVAFLLLATLSVAAGANATAVQIATAIMVIAPIVLPFVLKYIPLDGTKMVALAYAVSLVVAIVAGVASGLVKSADLTSAPGLLAAGTAVFGLMQLVYQLFKQNHTFGAKLVT